MTDGPFVCYRELVPATSVIDSTFFRRFSANGDCTEYLCTLVASGINMYKVCKQEDGCTYLSLQCTKRLFGKPNSVVSYRDSFRNDDMLVISIDAAKTIVLRCDLVQNIFETVLLCNCEENAFGTGSEVQLQLNGVRRHLGVGNQCSVCVCNESRLLCSTVYGQFLVLLPVTESSTVDTTPTQRSDVNIVPTDAAPNQGGFAVDVNAVLGLPGPIIDTCFLPGYSRPVLVVLQQSGLLPIGHAARVRHCCTVTALAVSAESKTLSILWQRTHLPYDALRLLPLTHAAYAGAVCVICMNSVIVVNQEEAQGVAMNGFAAVTVSRDPAGTKPTAYSTTVGVKSGDIGLQSWVTQEEGLELDASHWIEQKVSSQADVTSANGARVSPVRDVSVGNSRHAIIGTLKDGTILRISMAMSTAGMLSSVLLTPEVVAASVRASCFSASAAGDLWFLGSRQGSCVLLAVERRAVEKDGRALLSGAGASTHVSSFLSPASKRVRSSSVVSADDHDAVQRLQGADGTPHASPRKKANTSAVSVDALLDPDAEEFFALYGTSLDTDEEESGVAESSRASKNTLSNDRIELTIVDSFPVLGPVLDGITTKQDALFDTADAVTWERLLEPELRAAAPSTAASYIAERETRDGILLATGLDDDGAIMRVYHGLHLTKVAARNLPGATRVFSMGDAQYTVLLIVYDGKTRALHCAQEDGGASAAEKDRSELKFKELSSTDSGLICTASTLNMGYVQSGEGKESIAAQIVPQGIRLVRLSSAFGEEGDPLQDVIVCDTQEMGGLGGELGEAVLFGDVCAGYAAILTSNRTVYVMKYEAADESLELTVKVTARSARSEAMEVDGDCSSTLGAHITSDVVSVSLFHGVCDALPAAPGSHLSSASTVEAKKAAERTREEVYLYGAELPAEGTDAAAVTEFEAGAEQPAKKASKGKKSKKTAVDEPAEGSAAALLVAAIPAPIANASEQAYLVTTELNGTLSIVRLSTTQCVFQSRGFSTLADCVLSGTDYAPEIEGLIIETKLVRLSDAAHSGLPGSAVLCLTLLFSTGDIVVYRAVEVNGFIAAFHKVDQCPVTNRRAPDGSKLVRSFSADSTVGANGDADGGVNHSTFLNSAEYKSRTGPSLCYVAARGARRDGILVAGNDALFVTNAQGLPTTLPLGFSEVPCINYGQHCLVPFQVGAVNGIASLWFEWEDLDYIKNPAAAAANKATRPATLGIYQQVDGLEVYPAGGVSVKRVHVGKTVHGIVEVQNRTDDRTQQALLDKKTFLVSCSEERKQPFLPSVLTEEELQEDSELYERYFTSLNSFCQPDNTVGQAPPVSMRVHTLALLQGTSVVDTYALPLNECVVDAEVLYLTLEKYITMPGSIIPMKFTEKRVFVAACTAIIEKRGEDTQGNGRLLLFALDYALFEKDAEEGSAGSSSANGAVSEQTSSAATTGAGAATDSGAPKDLSSAQAKFLDAIKPKLRLQWSGPGPASVVKQLGDYVLSTVASTVYVYKFNTPSMELEQVAFFFTQLYITSVTVLKNYILLGDMHHSVQLLYWREADHALLPVSKDYEPTVPLCTEFLYDGPKLGMLMTDDEGNLQLFQENPRKAESIQGSRLLCLADFHLGSDASMLLRHDLLSTDPFMKAMPNPLDNRPPPPPPRSRKGSNFPLQKFGTRFNKATMPAKATVLVGTMDGGLSVVQPLEERMYRRLALLQQIMTMAVHTNFSLNPREYRLLKSARVRVARKKGVLDGCLLGLFTAMPPSVQDQLAATVGATAYLIKENLRELDYLCRYF